MTAHPARSPMIAALQRLSADPTVGSDVAEHASQLLRSVTDGYKVAITGPDPEDSSALTAALSSCDLNPVLDLQAIGRPQTAEDLQPFDVAIWVTVGFAQAEQSLWFQTPDALKDHSLLALRCADGDPTAEQISVDATEEFAACVMIGPRETAASAERLARVLNRIARDGQRADEDAILVFLDQHGPDLAATGEIPEMSTPHDQGAITAASAALANCATTLSQMSNDELAEPAEVIAHCAAAVNTALAALEGSDPPHAAFVSELHEATDMLVLLSIEDDAGSAQDAVALLIQLQKDFVAALCT